MEAADRRGGPAWIAWEEGVGPGVASVSGDVESGPGVKALGNEPVVVGSGGEDCVVNLVYCYARLVLGLISRVRGDLDVLADDGAGCGRGLCCGACEFWRD